MTADDMKNRIDAADIAKRNQESLAALLVVVQSIAAIAIETIAVTARGEFLVCVTDHFEQSFEAGELRRHCRAEIEQHLMMRRVVEIRGQYDRSLGCKRRTRHAVRHEIERREGPQFFVERAQAR